MNKLDRNAIRNIAITACGIAGLLCIIAGIILSLITGPAPIDDWDVERIEPKHEMAAVLDGKFDTLRADIANASSGDAFMLRISELEATSRLNQMAEDGDLLLEVTHPQVYFGDGMVRSTARIQFGITVQVAVQVELRAREGRVDFSVRRLDLGRLNVPRTLVNNVIKALERKLDQQWSDLPVTVDEIRVDSGYLILYLSVKDN